MPLSNQSEELAYEGLVLGRVASFRYLGLNFTAHGDLQSMAAARLAKAKGAQRYLVSLL